MLEKNLEKCLEVSLSADKCCDPIWLQTKSPNIVPTSNGVTIYIGKDYDDLAVLQLVQKGAARLRKCGFNSVKLLGTWTKEQAWAFYQGFYRETTLQEQDLCFEKDSINIIWPEIYKDELEKMRKHIGWMRNLVNAPSNILYPYKLCEIVANHLRDTYKQINKDKYKNKNFLEINIIFGKQLLENQNNYIGTYTVGKGSKNEPCVLEVDYNPSGRKEEKVFATLVGKGICFDSGGYDLKSSAGMATMKADMGGAAKVSAALALAISNNLDKRVKMYICCAENRVSSNSFVVGDIIEYKNGLKVEVNNTDAEGRLVLADGLLKAGENSSEYILDAATLTGAAKIAVGTDYDAILSFDDYLAKSFEEIASNNKELVWRLPLNDIHKDSLNIRANCISNISLSKDLPGASTAAGFLSHFVRNYKEKWLHIDCSANYKTSECSMWAKGATGVGTRTLAQFLLTHNSVAKENISP